MFRKTNYLRLEKRTKTVSTYLFYFPKFLVVLDTLL